MQNEEKQEQKKTNLDNSPSTQGRLDHPESYKAPIEFLKPALATAEKLGADHGSIEPAYIEAENIIRDLTDGELNEKIADLNYRQSQKSKFIQERDNHQGDSENLKQKKESEEMATASWFKQLFDLNPDLKGKSVEELRNTKPTENEKEKKFWFYGLVALSAFEGLICYHLIVSMLESHNLLPRLGDGEFHWEIIAASAMTTLLMIALKQSDKFIESKTLVKAGFISCFVGFIGLITYFVLSRVMPETASVVETANAVQESNLNDIIRSLGLLVATLAIIPGFGLIIDQAFKIKWSKTDRMNDILKSVQFKIETSDNAIKTYEEHLRNLTQINAKISECDRDIQRLEKLVSELKETHHDRLILGNVQAKRSIIGSYIKGMKTYHSFATNTDASRKETMNKLEKESAILGQYELERMKVLASRYESKSNLKLGAGHA